MKETLGGGHSTEHIGTRAPSDDDDCCCWLAGSSSSQAWVRCSVTRTRIPTVGSRWNSYHIPAHVTNWEEEEEVRSKSPISLFFFFSSPPPPAPIGTPAAAAAADPVESAPSWTHLIFRLLLLLPPTRCLLLVAEEYELIPFCLAADATKLLLISSCMVCKFFFFVRSLGIHSPPPPLRGDPLSLSRTFFFPRHILCNGF